MIPAILYGAEIILFTKKWVITLKVANILYKNMET